MALKPCPFCGDPMTTEDRAAGWFGHASLGIGCPIAREDFPPADIEGWNTRKTSRGGKA